MTELLMDGAPKKTPKGRLPVILIAVIVVGTCLVAGLFLSGFFGPPGWQDAPLHPNAQNLQTQVSNGGTTRTTTYTVNTDMEAASRAFIEQMIGTNWVSIPYIGQDSQYGWIDRSRNFSIPIINKHFINECPAYFLKVETKVISEKVSEWTIIQTVGPCGKPLTS